MKDSEEQTIRSFAHDVRNSLAVIRANAQRLQTKLKNHQDETVLPLVDKIDEKVDTIVAQINSLYGALEIRRG